eukprot:TRINITY_DN1511_c0_g3_i1.p1 TRINITY_DN1511_c0_g3~~TRINITY_DN1511_c0_g3_i1.p1  ORF type:complete len:458 (+),score=119.13 TRINITY_DN1511_c0_g3_i1:57-1430(+)
MADHPNALPIENRFTRIAQQYHNGGIADNNGTPYQPLPALSNEGQYLMNQPVMVTNSYVEPEVRSAAMVQPSHVNQELASGAQVCNPLPGNMMENSACCRLCGEKEKAKNIELGISTLIYPCKCIQPIHRKCLDNWRIVKKGQSFIKCDGCGCSYRLVVKEGVNLTAKKVKFGFFFARDTFLFLLLIQLLIIGCAFAIERIDSCSSAEGCGTNCKPHCGESGAPGGKLLNLFFIGKWEMGYKATYYLMGLCAFLAIVGVIGSWIWVIRKCCRDDKKNGGNSSSSTAGNEMDTCCLMCYFGSNSASLHHGTSGGTSSHYESVTTTTSTGTGTSSGNASSGSCACDCGNGCGDCNCGDCNFDGCDCDCGGGDAGGLVAVILVVAIAILVLFIILGMVFGFIGVTVVATKIFQRHYHILKRTELSKVYLVKDLRDEDRKNLPLTYKYNFDNYELQKMGLM